MTIQERIAAAKRSQSGLAQVGGQRGENRLPTISQRLDAAKSTGGRLGGVSMMPGAVSAITPTTGGAGGEVMSTGKFGRGGPQIRAVGAEELQLPAVRRKSVLTLPTFNRIDNSPGEPLASPQEVQNVQAQMKGLWRPSDALRDGVEDKSARRDELERQRSILQRAQGRYEGAWLDKVDMKPGESAADALKRVEAELADTDRELAGQHWNYYAADNEEQLARLARQPESGTLYEQAGTAGAPDVVIGRILSALQNGGAPEGDPAAVAQIRERFGVSPEKSGSTAQYMNDLTALLGTDLETRDVQTEAIGGLKRRGYNYSRISGYERTRKEAEEYARKMEERQEAAREHPVLSSAASVLASPLQGLDFLDAALRSMGPNSDEKDLSSYVPLDPYAIEATNLVRTLRGTVAEEIEKNTVWEIAGQNAASFLYQTGMSIADSAAQIAAFGPAATYFMGASAASNQAQDIMARGGTNRQVLLGGLAAGAAEAVFEKFSIDHLLSAKTVGGAKDLLRETLKQAGVEASEETFTEIANILSDAAIMGGSSGFELAVRDYEAQGMGREEARRRAYLDLVGQVAWAGAGGALSGGIMGGAVRGKQYLGGRLGGVELMPGAADTQTEGRQKAASTGEAVEYRAERPQNVELPTVPVINLSMQTVADMNGGVMPKAGNYIRKAALEKTEARLGLDKNPAAYIEASNVTRNGDAYVIKITKSSLNKMLSASSYPERVVPLESIAVLSQLERIAQNGVYFSSEGDRRGRAQIAGYDHLMTTVYIDGVPYLVDMRVRVEDEKAGGGNRLYHFTPETIEVTKKNDGAASTAGRHATSVRSTDTAPSSDPTITQDGPGVKGKDARMVGAVFLPGSGLDAGAAGPYNGAKEAVGYGRGEEALTGLQGVPGADVRGENPGADAGGAGGSKTVLGAISETARGTKSIPGWAEGHVVENPRNPAAVRGTELAGAYIPDTIVVEDSALKQLNPCALAMTSNGTICLSDAIEADMVDTVSYHEVVHAVKQRGSVEYKAFLGAVGGRLNFQSPSLDFVLHTVRKSRFGERGFFDLSPSEVDTVFDELNALVWGHFKADPEHARAEFGGVFTDFDGYIAELDAIMEGARGAYAEGGRTPPGGEGAALDAGERRALEEGWRDEEPGGEGAALDAGEQRALEEGWRDEEPGVRAAGPYNGAKEAGGYGRGEEALTGLQGVPGADVRGENRGPEATDAGIP